MQVKKLIKCNKISTDGLLILPNNITMDGNYSSIHLSDNNRHKLIELLYILSDDLDKDKSNRYNRISCSLINDSLFILRFHNKPKPNNILPIGDISLIQGKSDYETSFYNFDQFEIINDNIYFFGTKSEKKILNRIHKIKNIKNRVN